MAFGVLSAYVQSVGDRLAARSRRPRLPWTFRLLDDPDPSAYAMVGGYVYVSRGMLAHPTTDLERRRADPYRIRIATVRHAFELERFVFEQCPAPGELGRIADLEGLRPTDRVSPGDLVRCIEPPAR